jgi:hypothetical protein
MTVVSNSTTLVHLSATGRLDLLRVINLWKAKKGTTP